MCEAVGHPVTRLVRTRIGPLQRPPPGARRVARTLTAGRGPRSLARGRRAVRSRRYASRPVNDRPRRGQRDRPRPDRRLDRPRPARGRAGTSPATTSTPAGSTRRVDRAAASTPPASTPTPTITFVAVPVLAVADQVKRALAETDRRRHRRRRRQGRDRRGRRRPPLRRRPPDGRQRARRARRRRRGDVQRRRVGAHAGRRHRRRHVRRTSPRVVAQLGAEVVAMAPERHDEMVAVVSHVPHLTAASLMGVAADRAEEHAALLRLAAGGFRDMTRVASGQPDIWLDICAENRPAILSALDALIDRPRRDARDRRHRRPRRAARPAAAGPRRPHQPADPRHPPAGAGRGAHPDPRPHRRGGRDLHAGRRARRQHRQLRGRPPRREQRRRRRRARRRRRRRPVPRRADRPRLPPGRHAA